MSVTATWRNEYWVIVITYHHGVALERDDFGGQYETAAEACHALQAQVFAHGFRLIAWREAAVPPPGATWQAQRTHKAARFLAVVEGDPDCPRGTPVPCRKADGHAGACSEP